MKRSKVFLKNAVILSAASIVIQALDVWFKVYVTNYAGSQAMGMFQLIMSVYTFALTLAMSGINLASTRLVAEEIGKKNGDVSSALKKSVAYALSFGTLSAILLFTLSGFIAESWLMNPQTELSLKLLSLMLPLISVTSVYNGYFNAARRVVKSASYNFADQLLKTVIAIIIFSRFSFNDVSSACVCVVLSSVAAEFISFIYACVLFKADRKKYSVKSNAHDKTITKRMLGIALPMAFSSYVRSGLLAIEHLMIPISLKKFGSSYENALSVYGIIHGIVLPILLFPSAVINSFAGLLIPELSENMASKGLESKKNTRHSITDLRTNYIIKRVYQITLTFAVPVCAVFIFFSDEIARLTANGNADAAFYIKILALMVPIMYLDSVTDSFLKALNEQVKSMIYNILDSGICVILVITLLPIWGIKGYIFVLYISEIFNTTLSVMRLVTVANFKFDLKRWIIFPALISSASVFISKGILSVFGGTATYFGSVLLISMFAVLYIGLLLLTKTFRKEDVMWAVSFFKKDSVN